MIWRYASPDERAAGPLASALKISLPLARLLVSRGYPDSESAARFLNPRPSHFHDPFLLQDMDRAVERMGRAISGGERIFVFGDYDVDGLTSIAQIDHLLEAAGLDRQLYQPNRLKEGYGLSRKGVERALDFGAGLMLVLDCGTEAVEPIELARSRGLDVIVIDHHRPSGPLPEALAILNPSREDCPYPFKGLAAAGVVFKFLHGGKDRWGVRLDWERLYQLAGLGTVADVTPLVDENRVLAAAGLSFLARRPHPGLRALLDAAGVKAGPVTAVNLSFQIAPRLNAAGRLGRAELALRLLTSSDRAEIAGLAGLLDRLNRERQAEQRAIVSQAEEMIESDRGKYLGKGIVVDGEGWNKGVVGLVASKILEKYWRPTVVIAREGELGSGSGRSIPGFNLFGAISRCREHLITFGGHRAAAGLRIETSRIGDFRRAFAAAADGLREEDLVPCLEVNGTLDPAEISLQLLEELDRLEPCGEGNPLPVFSTTVDRLTSPPRVMGKTDSHLKFSLPGSPGECDCVGWGMAGRAGELSAGPIDLAFRLEADTFRNRRRIQLILEDFHSAISGPRCGPEIAEV